MMKLQVVDIKKQQHNNSDKISNWQYGDVGILIRAQLFKASLA